MYSWSSRVHRAHCMQPSCQSPHRGSATQYIDYRPPLYTLINTKFNLLLGRIECMRRVLCVRCCRVVGLSVMRLRSVKLAQQIEVQFGAETLEDTRNMRLESRYLPRIRCGSRQITLATYSSRLCGSRRYSSARRAPNFAVQVYDLSPVSGSAVRCATVNRSLC